MQRNFGCCLRPRFIESSKSICDELCRCYIVWYTYSYGNIFKSRNYLNDLILCQAIEQVNGQTFVRWGRNWQMNVWYHSEWVQRVVSCHFQYFEDINDYTISVSKSFIKLYKSIKPCQSSSIYSSPISSCQAYRMSTFKIWLMNYIEFVYFSSVSIEDVSVMAEALHILDWKLEAHSDIW